MAGALNFLKNPGMGHVYTSITSAQPSPYCAPFAMRASSSSGMSTNSG